MDKTLQRIQSIDVLRGIIMIIMALDHTRDFFHIDAMTDQPTNLDTTTPALFFTRWITHFCAPLFVFLSGTSIYLQSLRKTKKELSLFLLTRGLWLIIAEFTIVGFGWSFDIFFSFFFLQVIWAIGASMVILSVLIYLRYWALLAIGILITALHNILDTHTFTDPTLDVLANLFLLTEFDVMQLGGGVALMCAYAALPWTGIMLLGYALGKWYSPGFDTVRRKKLLLSTGFAVISLFVLLRLSNGYGDPKPWTEQKDAMYTFLSFLNVNKYPPSLMYACMTLGPAMIALALLENVRNRVTDILNIFGRVPFLYYLAHIYIIHLLCVVLFYAEGYTFADNFKLDMAFGFRPKENFGFSLGIVYLIWILVVALCWFPTKWYEKYKRTHKKWWLSYI
ncbi:heparan-alpha-glucosaminide N-acetyltransferase domain-containing protein [Flavobacterium sp. MFBS3-15]|uniref:DUF1624 domain-containing protein n=1 Tax=Flavobacterium sp. MFBS3-15 TaxID=2989816 RepID=UPI00223562AC|nr:heparan-alpha-glucosaminide N-acetyltransferase domain-containing protein [Flavobacterium sp. MFBS3-15]MCW4467450.1 heparan-alpha-glucosaminide N-acetyltransferase domain-containing protein [Flavobacterium sp. MFBS3-15]